MKTKSQTHNTTKYVQVITALALTSIFSLSGSFALLKSAVASSIPGISNAVQKQNLSVNSLPRAVKNAVFRDISRRENIPVRQLKVVNSQERAWRNGCLELPRPGELCTQALVAGWRVLVSSQNQNQTWVYHTNRNGQVLRLAANNISNPVNDDLPSSVRNAVVKAASKQLKNCCI